MTDNEIIKALESVEEWFTEHGRNTNTAVIGISRQALDLIKRQQAEIEQLRKNDFDNLDFSKCSIDEKYWALLFLAVVTCKDMEFLKIIRDKFLVGLENADRKETEG